MWVQTDVVIKVTSTCICGSDLHIYENVIPGEASA
jgi:threonine dehydrogenase-like Zn-dependent dehydrogenase